MKKRSAISDQLSARLLNSPLLVVLVCVCVLLGSNANVLAQTAQNGDGTESDPQGRKPTRTGLRFTPKMADSLGVMYTRFMKPRYELNDEQVGEIQKIISKQYMDFFDKNQDSTQAAMEFIIPTMIENEGWLPKQDAEEFAKLMKPLMPALNKFFTDSSAKIGKEMTSQQRLKFTGDMALFSTGFVGFENRIKEWEQGKAADFSRLFSGAERKEDPPSNSKEAQSPEYARARRDVESDVERDTDYETRWDDYVKYAIEYYGLDEAQADSAKAILEESRKKAKAIKTDSWQESIVENRVARRLTWAADRPVSRGPWAFRLESEYERLTKPLEDLNRDFKQRIEELPTSDQRQNAEREVRKQLDEKGLKFKG